jgi:hypothetical protein
MSDRIPEIHLYLDDSGSRLPDHRAQPRDDNVDCFALGGILVLEEQSDFILTRHAELLACHGLDCPLHSNSIRTKTRDFRWMVFNREKATAFLQDLERLLCEAPVLCTACVVDRKGYNVSSGAL